MRRAYTRRSSVATSAEFLRLSKRRAKDSKHRSGLVARLLAVSLCDCGFGAKPPRDLDEIVVLAFIERSSFDRCRAFIRESLSGHLIELLQLLQDLRAQREIVLANEGQATAQILVDRAQGGQVALLRGVVRAQTVAIGDYSLDGSGAR